MINLLPPEEKKEILTMRKLKLVLIFETALFLFLLSLSLLLLSVRIYLAGELKIEQALVSQAKEESNLKGINDFQKEIDSVNRQLAQVHRFYEEQPSLSLLFQKIFSRLPQGAFLTNFSFRRGPKNISQVDLAGFILSREDLLNLKQNFEREADFQNFLFPAANWVEPENINFSLSFELSHD